MARIIGYDRSLTGGDAAALADLGCAQVFTEARAGTSVLRPALEAALAAMAPGDVLAVARLSVLAHDERDLAPLLLDLHARGLELVSRDDGLDTRADGGAVFAFARMLERLHADAAAERRRRSGPAAAREIDEDDWDEIEPLLRAGDLSVAEAAEQLQVGRAAVLRRMKG